MVLSGEGGEGEDVLEGTEFEAGFLVVDEALVSGLESFCAV